MRKKKPRTETEREEDATSLPLSVAAQLIPDHRAGGQAGPGRAPGTSLTNVRHRYMEKL